MHIVREYQRRRRAEKVLTNRYYLLSELSELSEGYLNYYQSIPARRTVPHPFPPFLPSFLPPLHARDSRAKESFSPPLVCGGNDPRCFLESRLKTISCHWLDYTKEASFGADISKAISRRTSLSGPPVSPTPPDITKRKGIRTLLALLAILPPASQVELVP